jgi:hypothetical protein
MPRRDKSSYTDKQKRQAEHTRTATRSVASRTRKRNAAPGRPSTPRRMAARSQAPAGARKKTTPHREKAADSAAVHEVGWQSPSRIRYVQEVGWQSPASSTIRM